MADLSTLQSAQAVTIAGADSSGVESGFVNQYNAQLSTSDLLNGTAVQSTLTVNTTAVECKVGATNLTNRKMLIIQAAGTNITFGFSSASQPFTLANGTTMTWAVGPNISIWVRRNTGSGNVHIAEIS